MLFTKKSFGEKTRFTAFGLLDIRKMHFVSKLGCPESPGHMWCSKCDKKFLWTLDIKTDDFAF